MGNDFRTRRIEACRKHLIPAIENQIQFIEDRLNESLETLNKGVLVPEQKLNKDVLMMKQIDEVFEIEIPIIKSAINKKHS